VLCLAADGFGDHVALKQLEDAVGRKKDVPARREIKGGASRPLI